MSESNQAVFLSYASQDADAATRIVAALRAAGVEVWFDQNELVGGDAWDQKIRGQIKACALFVPVISAATQARREGYFRLEWKLAAQRTHTMADGTPFLLPVVIDATKDGEALVPEEFRAVQWTRLPGGEGAAEEKFCARVGKLLGGDAGEAGRTRGAVRDTDFAGTATNREGASALKKNRVRWIAPIIGGVCIAAMAWVFTRPWQKTTSGAAQPVSATVTKSPARQLAGKALGVALDGSATIEALRSAMAIADKAATEDPLDGEIWAISALVDLSAYESATDVSEKRRDSIRSKLARAKGLAATAPLTQYAEVKTLVRIEPTPPGLKAAEEIVRGLLDRVIVELSRAHVLSMLSMVLEGQQRFAEAARVAEEAGSWSGASWAYLLAGDLPRALRMAERQTETDPAGGLFQQMNVQFARGDLDAWEAAIQRLPATARLEERTQSIQLWQAYYRRDRAALLAAARRFSEEYIHNTYIKQARGFFSGVAHQWAGRPDAARGDWTEALRVVEQRIVTEPKVGHLQLSRLWLLAKLGRRDEAGAALELFRQRNQDPWMESELTALLMLLGREDEALDQLEKLLRPLPRPYWSMHTVARYADVYDSLRGRARFEKLLHETLLSGAKPFDDPKPAAAVPASDAKSVAVLAFKNVGSDPANEALLDGIGLELIAVLGRVQGLTVRGGSSLEFSKASKATTQEKGRQLAATYLVDGSVQRGGDTVRITASVTRAATDEIVWTSAPLKRDVRDFFAVQEEIAGLIAQALSLKLTAKSPASTAAVNPQAFGLYLQGRAAWRLRTTEGETKAEQLFRQALAIDPDFARAHAGLADVWVVRVQRENSAAQLRNRNDAVMDQAMFSARRALQLDPSLAEAHGVLGTLLWMDWKMDDAIREHREAVALNPNDATAHQRLGRALLTDGRIDEALAALRRAHELDPLFARIADNYSIALIGARRFEEAVAIADRALALQPELRQALAYKAVALAEMGRTEAAIAAARRYTESAGPLEQDATPTWVAYALARAKHSSEAEQLLARVPASKRQAVAAAAWLALGKREQAFAVLRAGNSNVTVGDVLLWWPVFDAEREAPEFRAAIAAMGFTEAHARAQAWRASQAKAR